MKSFRIVVFSLVFLLSACTQLTLQQQQQQQQQQQKYQTAIPQQLSLSKIPDNWTLSGRISIIQAEENWHARFYWVKQRNQFQLRFTGPLGETHLYLEQLKQGASFVNTLIIGNKKYISEGDIEDLLSLHSDINIPVNSLKYWIFGQHNPDYAFRLKLAAVDGVAEPQATKNTAITTIKELIQQQWTILFSRYEAIDDAIGIPHQLNLFPKKIIAKNGRYSIKVFVSSRSLN